MADPDVFISYARDDAATARKFADGLEAAGLTVWWDDALRSGQVFDEAIEQALRAAKAVVVLWSPHSVQSRWVRAEATLADRNGTLAPAMIAPCERPIIFEMVHTADLSGWQGDAADPAWRTFSDHLRQLVGGVAGAASPPAQQRRSLPDKPSVAVLPFVNLSGDPEQDYFADGVVDDVITALTRFDQLFVIARSSSFTYKGRQVDNRTVADELGVRFVLEGSIRKSGHRLRITGHLVDAQSGEHLWADKFDGGLEDVFDLQDQITEAVVGVIEPSIQQFNLRRSREKPTDNLDAYDLYLQALPHLWSFDPERNAPARALLGRALELDPNYPHALAAMAWALEQSRWYHPDDRDLPSEEEATRMATRLARRALATDTDDAHLIALCGFLILFTDRDRQTAIAAKERALLRNANSSWANHYASLIEIYTGQPQAALDLAERALRQNPIHSSRSHFLLAMAEALCGLGRFEEAAAAFERYIGDMPEFLPGLLLGARAYARLGEMDRAHALAHRILQIDPALTVEKHMARLPRLPAQMEQAWREALVMAGIPA